MRIGELLEIADKVDFILHDYGYSVDHGILSHYLFRIIKDSHPNDNIELEHSETMPAIGLPKLRHLPEIV